MVSLHIVWIGGGSLGLLFAAKFAAANLSSHLLVRSEAQSQMITHSGLKLIEADRELTAFSACSTLSSRWSGPTPDWFALMVKQNHLTEAFITQLAELMASFPQSRLLCFQNGIGHVERLAEFIAEERIFTAVTTEAALRITPDTVQHTGRGMTWFGHNIAPELLGAEEAAMLTDAFAKAGFSVSMSNNINDKVWDKLLINAVINPLTALLRVKNGALLGSPAWMQLMGELFEETKQVAHAEGGVMKDHLWDALLEVCAKTSDNESSMLQDVSNGRETEVDWINGSIVRLGERYGVPTPINRMLFHLLKGFSDHQCFPDRR